MKHQQEILKRLHEARKMNAAQMRLQWGEMTAQEIRSIRAVLKWIDYNEEDYETKDRKA